MSDAADFMSDAADEAEVARNKRKKRKEEKNPPQDKLFPCPGEEISDDASVRRNFGNSHTALTIRPEILKN
ncbi:MAG: hypothetical protein ACO35C_03260 [Pontimonas sp.]